MIGDHVTGIWVRNNKDNLCHIFIIYLCLFCRLCGCQQCIWDTSSPTIVCSKYLYVVLILTSFTLFLHSFHIIPIPVQESRWRLCQWVRCKLQWYNEQQQRSCAEGQASVSAAVLMFIIRCVWFMVRLVLQIVAWFTYLKWTWFLNWFSGCSRCHLYVTDCI